MKDAYLEITYRQGRPLAAYYYLPREAGAKSARTRRFEPGLVVDYSDKDVAIGVEITAPSRITLDDLNALLTELGVGPMPEADFAPLSAA